MPNQTNATGLTQLTIKGTNTKLNNAWNLAVVLDFLKKKEIESILLSSSIWQTLQNTAGKVTLHYPNDIVALVAWEVEEAKTAWVLIECLE